MKYDPKYDPTLSDSICPRCRRSECKRFRLISGNTMTWAIEDCDLYAVHSELYTALGGLYAYDVGAVDSGIRDEALRQRVMRQLNAMTNKDLATTLGRIVRDLFLIEEKLAQGYGIEDVADFIEWVSRGLQR